MKIDGHKLSPTAQRRTFSIDATPDGGYALRILRRYREDCGGQWVGEPSLLLKAMNEMLVKRAAELDKAIAVLERALGNPIRGTNDEH